MRKAILLIASVVRSSAAQSAKAFTHPGVPLNLTELNAVRSRFM